MKRLEITPVVALLGARQVGKTTLSRIIARQYDPVTHFDLELPSGRRALETSPEHTLRSLEGLVVLDEIQRIPSLFELLRPLCDDPNRRARFLVLGSASPEIVRGVSESLAGRILLVPVHGFSLAEVGPDNQDLLWLRGGFPRSYLARSDAAAGTWIEGMRRTFLERDIPAIGSQVPAAKLERFWNMLAHFHGQTWNAAEVARAMDMGPSAANQYRDILSGTFMLRVLWPWFENLGKRQIKSPKVYLRDTGVLHQFLGITSLLELRSHIRYGASWEGFCIEQCLHHFGEGDAYFWSAQSGAELDLMLFRHGKRWGFEFKCSDAPSTSKSMHVAIHDLGLEHLWVIYPGTLRYALTDRITALPLRELPKLELQPRPVT